jgi:hypothetical protein
MKRAAIKGYVAGIVTMLLLSGTVLMASPEARQIVFGVGVSIDGVAVDFDEDMRPFIMDDRTFLPVRAIADIAGFGVDFDLDTNTVLLTTGDGPAAVQRPITQDLVGEWVWTQPFLVFNADGRGTMDGSVIGWWTDQGALYICTTPNACLDNCPLPVVWYYTIDGNLLTLVGRYDPDLYFTYTMGGPEEAQAAGAESLVGEWLITEPLYVLNADGRGTMDGRVIGWWTHQGALYICTTPNACLDNCPLPVEWYYTIDGDRLTLARRFDPSIYYTYIRN